MWRILLLGLTGFMGLSTYGQIKKHFTVENSNTFDRVHITLSGGSGTCYVRPTPNSNPVNVYGKSETDMQSPACESILADRTQWVNVNFLDAKVDQASTKTVSFNVFSWEESKTNNQWHVYLSKKKPVLLNLNYGMGDAFVDLSGLSVERLKVNTGSADVKVGYVSGQYNQQEMDTFSIKVDLGELEARHIALSNARNIIADVGFGTLFLDFTDQNQVRSHVQATVGAGNLIVDAANSANPMIIYIHNSPLCRVKIPKSFKQIRKNVYVTDNYRDDAENLITFNVDVTMGNIIFKSF